MADLTFDIWQFVRLMDHLETSTGKEGGDARSLFDAWRDLWETVDGDLARLHETDFDAYADMMMNQTITIADASSSQVAFVAETLKTIATIMDEAATAERAKPEPDKDQIENLTFESEELRQLRKSMTKLTRGA